VRLHLRTQPLHKQHIPTLCSQWFTHYCFTHTQLDIPPKLTTSVTVPWEQGGGIKQDCSRNNTWACLIQATHLRPAKASLWARLTTRPTTSSALGNKHTNQYRMQTCAEKSKQQNCATASAKQTFTAERQAKQTTYQSSPTKTRKGNALGMASMQEAVSHQSHTASVHGTRCGAEPLPGTHA
jgi:hypothetical protein